MTFSKEARIGLLVGVAFLIFFAGFYFLKGANLFSGENEYYAYFDDVQGLQPASPVQVKGLGVGRVSKIELDDNGKVKVTIAVTDDVVLMQGSEAKLASADLLGSKVISLQLGTGTTEIPDEATIPGSVEGGLIDGISKEITPLILDLRHVVATLDTVFVGINSVLDPEARQHLRNSIVSLDATMQNFTVLSSHLKGESDELANIIRNTNSITSNLANSNQQITNIMKNAEIASDKLAAAPIDETIKSLNVTVKELNGIMDKVNNNEGSLGMLVHDKELYNNLALTLKTLDLLLADLKARPSRYINVSIFGRKREK